VKTKEHSFSTAIEAEVVKRHEGLSQKGSKKKRTNDKSRVEKERKNNG